MALDKEALTRIYNEANSIDGGKNTPISTERIFNAMQATYELGVQSERERCASLSQQLYLYTGVDIADAIRKGE